MEEIRRAHKAVLRLAAALLVCYGAHAQAAPMTNADIVKLLEAGMQEDVILQAIASSEPRFDTSAQALVRLKERGATPAILKAILSPKGAPTAAPGAAPLARGAAPSAASTLGGLNPEELILVLNGQESTMQYIVPNMRMAARALGLGGFASYASLAGTSAQKRLSDPNPQFIISVPKNAQPVSYATLASFVTRPNGTREVIVGGGYMSYTTGIHRDRVIPTQTEPLADQSRARDGFVLYRIWPTSPLPRGEYAVVLYTGEIRVAGFFTSGTNSFFDFGID